MSFVLKLKFSRLILVTPRFSRYCKETYETGCTAKKKTHPDNIWILLELLSAGRHIDHLAPDAGLCVFPDGGLPPPAVVHGRLQVIVLGGVVPLPLGAGAWTRDKGQVRQGETRVRWLQSSKAYQPDTVSPTVRENEGRSKEGMRLSNNSFTVFNDGIACVKDLSKFLPKLIPK